MKRSAVASLVVLMLGTFGLAACGGGEKVKELEGQVQALTTKNTELETAKADLQKQLDECKAGTAATPAASPEPTKAGGKPTATKKPAATPTPVPPTPTPVPSIKPEIKNKLKLK